MVESGLGKDSSGGGTGRRNLLGAGTRDRVPSGGREAWAFRTELADGTPDCSEGVFGVPRTGRGTGGSGALCFDRAAECGGSLGDVLGMELDEG